MTSDPSVDVLAAQVRAPLDALPVSGPQHDALAALAVLVGYAKRAEELEAKR